MLKYLTRIALLLPTALILAACGSDTTEPPVSADADFNDFAIGVTGDQAGLPGLLLGSAGSPATAGCAFSDATGRIECPDVLRGGLTFSRSVQLLDANGVPQAQRGPNVVSVNTRINVSGATNHGGGELTVARQSDLTVTGLGPQSTEHVHNGIESGTISGSRDHPTLGTINTSEQFTHTTTDVVIPRLRAGRGPRPFPLSGTSTRSVQHTRTVAATSQTTTVSYSESITFNGTAIVPVVVTRNGEVRNCLRNLLTGRMNCE